MFVRRVVAEECSGFFRGGKDSNGVEKSPAYPFRVGCRVGCRKVELGELVVDLFINDVAGWEELLGSLGLPGPWGGNAGNGDLAGVPCGDGSFAVAEDSGDAGFVINFGEGGVGRGEESPWSHITLGAVAEKGGDFESLFFAFLEERVRWGDFDAFDGRIVFGWTWSSLLNPCGDGLVIWGIFVEDFAAFVFESSGWFGQEKTAGRVGWFNAATVGMLCNIIVIGGWIVGVEREPKTAFASDSSMATSSVAASFGEDRQNVVTKADWIGCVEK